MNKKREEAIRFIHAFYDGDPYKYIMDILDEQEIRRRVKAHEALHALTAESFKKLFEERRKQ